MQIKLQDYVPYSQSLKWKIHDDFFKEEGADAWKKGWVPYDITCNSCAAWQQAMLVYEAVHEMEACGELMKGEPINVIEFASGIGLFAINFIRRFDEICANKNADYAERLVYFFSDYADKTLADAIKVPELKKLRDGGRLRFMMADVCNPAEMSDYLTGEKLLTGEKPLAGGNTKIQFTAAISNYLHCVLPLTILRKKDNKLFEKYTSLSAEVKKDMKMWSERKDGDEPWKGIPLEALKENAEYRPIRIEEFFKRMEDFEAIDDAVKYYDTATIIYPFGSFEAVRNFVPMMKKGAIYVISDKGYPDPCYMCGDNECKVSMHGNCFAHSFNFPLMEFFARKIGLNAMRTSNFDYNLQTMVLQLPLPASSRSCFREIFVRNNPNHESHKLVQAAIDAEKNADYLTAVESLKIALKYRPYEAKIFYKLGNNYQDLKEYGKALSYYEEGLPFNYFNIYDIYFEIGQVNYLMQHYKEAVTAYAKSAESNEVNRKFAYLNIGLCQRELGDEMEAKNSFSQALKIDPNYKRAKELLNK